MKYVLLILSGAVVSCAPPEPEGPSLVERYQAKAAARGERLFEGHRETEAEKQTKILEKLEHNLKEDRKATQASSQGWNYAPYYR